MFLFHILISPLIYLFEILVASLHFLLSPNPVIAIFIISFIVNFLSYPVFAKIEDMLKKDNDDYQKLLPKINSIKRNFNGSERRMLLQTYFRQNNYHPLLAHFRQSLTIFLQVPIFVASYIVITSSKFFQIPLLETVNDSLSFSFLPIHILPILMTLINIISVQIYTKNKSLGSRIYAYILPVIFLVLLYFSPASIVLYWTFNNTFGLLRNIWFLRRKQFFIWAISFALAFIVLAFGVSDNLQALYIIGIIIILFKFLKFINKDAFYLLIVLMFCSVYFIMQVLNLVVPNDSLCFWIIWIFFYELFIGIQKYILNSIEWEPKFKDFSLCTLLMFVTFSIYLPLKLINSSPDDFYQLIDLSNLLNSEIAIGLGLFFIYPSLLFYILKKQHKIIFFLTLNLLIIFMTSMHTFEQPRDTLNAYMQFGLTTRFSTHQRSIFDFSFCILSILLSTVLIKYRFLKYIKLLLSALLIVYILASLKEFNSFKFQNIETKADNNISLTLSSNHKNVLIIFIDRAISGFFPLILKELPALESELKGFSYYPYTISFATHTFYSVPSLFGGYNCTPLKLQNDTSMKIVDKYNNALNLLPELFQKSGYHVSLYAMPYIHNENDNQKSIFPEGVRFIDTKSSKNIRKKESIDTVITNVMWFIIFRISPYYLKDTIYNNGNYLSPRPKYKIYELLAQIEYNYFESFIKNVKVSTTAPGEFSIFISLLTHQPTAMTKDYKFISKDESDSPQLGNKSQDYRYHYNVNMLSWMEITKLLKKLKQLRVYNNTKIIILSDHGWPIYDLDLINPKITLNNAILLVKDFNSNGNLKLDSTFMTLADVPYLSTHNALQDEFNPFNLRDTVQKKQHGVDIIPHHLKRCVPSHYDDPDRTYLYDEEVEYMHIDENNIKDLIKIEEGFLD